MYDYTTYRNFCNAIQSASDARTFYTAIREYLNNSAMEWWHGLQENERKAIILLDFDPSVVTTMVFFGRGWGFGGGYHDVLEAILDKADLLTNEKELGDWDYDLRTIICYARMQAQAEQEARAKAAAIAQEMDLAAGYKALETLLVENSGTVCNNKKCKMEHAKDMRKTFLAGALTYLRKNYDKGE